MAEYASLFRPTDYGLIGDAVGVPIAVAGECLATLPLALRPMLPAAAR